MKKQFLAVAFLALAAGSASATDAPVPVRVSVQLMKNGVQSFSWETSAIEGQREPMSHTKTVAYVAECDFDSKGAPVLKSETLTTGIEAMIVPTQVDAEGATIAITLHDRELHGMKTTNVKGCPIVSPSIGKHEMSAQVRVRPGEKVELPGINGADKYVLVVRRL